MVAAAFEGPAEEFLVGVGAVDLCGVDERDAQVDRTVDGADRLGVVAAGAGVGEGHAHRAQADPADIQAAELYMLHDRSPLCVSVSFLRIVTRHSIWIIPGMMRQSPSPPPRR